MQWEDVPSCRTGFHIRLFLPLEANMLFYRLLKNVTKFHIVVLGPSMRINRRLISSCRFSPPFSEGEKQWPEMHLRFAGYLSPQPMTFGAITFCKINETFWLTKGMCSKYSLYMFISSLFLISQIHTELSVIIFDWAEYSLYFAFSEGERMLHFYFYLPWALSINL